MAHHPSAPSKASSMPVTVLQGAQLRKELVQSSQSTHSWSGSPVCAPKHRAAADTPAGPAQASAVSLGRSPSGQQWPPGPGQGNPSACAPAPASIAPEGPLSESFLGEKTEESRINRMQVCSASWKSAAVYDILK